MRIFAASIGTETNTFAPIPTALETVILRRLIEREVQGVALAPIWPLDERVQPVLLS